MSESLCQPKNDAIPTYSMEQLPISDRLTNAQALKQADQFNEAIELYIEIINTSDVCDAKYVACFELFDCYNSLNRSDDGLSYLSIPSTDNIYRIECVYRLIRHFCCRNDFKTAHMHYTHIQEYFENKYPTDDISQHLFTHKNEYEFFLPYYMITGIGLHRLTLS